MENQYNLLKREEEREMLPMCADMGVGCVPYSPLGKGRLARPWGQHTQRGDTDQVAKSFDLDVDQPVVDAVQQIAEKRGVPMAQIAMAWVLSKPVVTAAIVGATKPHHLADAAAPLQCSSPRTKSGASKSPTRLNLPIGGKSTSALMDPLGASSSLLRPHRSRRLDTGSSSCQRGPQICFAAVTRPCR